MRKLPQVLLLSLVGALAGREVSAQVPNLTMPRLDERFCSPGEPCEPDPGEPDEPTPVTLSWNPPTRNVDDSPLTDLAGYIIYFGQTPHSLTGTMELNNPGLTRYVFEALPEGRWYFAMTAVTRRGRESVLSEIVSKHIT